MTILYNGSSWAASAALVGITLVPLGTFWGLSLRRRTGQRTQATKLAQLFLRIALPVWIFAVALSVVTPSIYAANFYHYDARLYTSLVSSFLVDVAGILTTLAVYLSSVSVLYAVLGKEKWWKMLRLDALCGAGLLFVLVIAWLGRRVDELRRSEYSPASPGLAWLVAVLDVVLTVLAAGEFGMATYVAARLKKRADLASGNLSALLLSASFLWLFRCAFVTAVDIKTVISDWTSDEQSLQKILRPLLDYWVSATVLGLLTFILRHPTCSGPASSSIPNHPSGPQPQPLPQVVYVAHPGYYQHTQYGLQPYPPTQVYQGGFQYPQMYPHLYPPQPVPDRKMPSELSPTPVPAHRVHEVEAAERQVAERPELEGPQAGK